MVVEKRKQVLIILVDKYRKKGPRFLTVGLGEFFKTETLLLPFLPVSMHVPLLLCPLILLLAVQPLISEHFLTIILVPDMPALLRQDN